MWLASLVAFHRPLASLLQLALSDERYTQVLLVPVISGFLIWLQPWHRSGPSRYSPRAGLVFVLAGVALDVLERRFELLGSNENLSISIFTLLLVWMGIAALTCGTARLRQAIFPILLFAFFIPLPSDFMNRAVVWLQTGSADVSAGLFKAIGMPFLRDGVLFAVPGITIKVAEECSGIRSSLSLLMAGIVAGHLLLSSGWKQFCFALLIVPIAILKNAVRIVTIAWLGVYVDRGYFFGILHRYGGFPFSVLAITMLAAILWAMRKRNRFGAAGESHLPDDPGRKSNPLPFQTLSGSTAN